MTRVTQKQTELRMIGAHLVGNSRWSGGSYSERSTMVQPLAQDYTIVAHVPDPEHFIHDPGMTCLPDGTLVAAVPCWRRSGEPSHILMRRSADGGATWEPLGELPYTDAALFVVDDALYMFVQSRSHRDICFMRSEDAGETWTGPSPVIEGPYWNCQTGTAIHDGRLYWAVGVAHREIAAIAADLSKDLLRPSAWRISNRVRPPEIPDSLTRRMYAPDRGIWQHQWGSDIWLEPNVVNVFGNLRLLMRVVIDEYSTTNMCAVCDLDDDGEKLRLEFTQLHPLPGGQNKFYILYDEETGYFWMASNSATDAQDFEGNHDRLVEIGLHGGPGNERRWLMLWYSIDALNWFPAGCIARWASPVQSFMYPSMAFDGDDIVLLSRTSRDSGDQHDADLATFHRIRDFRALAMDLWARI